MLWAVWATIKVFFFSTDDAWQHWNHVIFEEELRDLWFTDEATGYAAGYGVIYKTENGGETWFPLDIKGDFFTAIHFPTPEVGYAVGNQGIIVKTGNAGHSWEVLKKVKSVKRQHFEDVFFINADKGYVVGKNVVLFTNDGGINWQAVQDLDFARFTGIFMLSENTGYITGSDGTIIYFEE